MSELRIVKLSEMNAIKLGLCNDKLYFKSEADKVIAELETKLAVAQQTLRLNKPEALFSDLEIMGRLKHQIDVVERRERHQKYKRCLAMAKWCFTKSNYHFVLARHGEDSKENNRKSILYSRWRERWLELAKEPTWERFLQLIHKEAT